MGVCTHTFTECVTCNFFSRSTTNIVKAAQKVISNPSSSPSPQDNVRQDMKPMRGKGPSPRILACADAKAEGMWLYSKH